MKTNQSLNAAVNQRACMNCACTATTRKNTNNEFCMIGYPHNSSNRCQENKQAERKICTELVKNQGQVKCSSGLGFGSHFKKENKKHRSKKRRKTPQIKKRRRKNKHHKSKKKKKNTTNQKEFFFRKKNNTTNFKKKTLKKHHIQKIKKKTVN